ncbi:MAG TPA: aldo/keto reductase [Pseudonocardiaceae bacterium]|jgi:aryl-alcohol dehydrogenase-like predicted oxidoreductase|nr:aldo/keto reductase [Pseudonocardiaceae bacterium]
MDTHTLGRTGIGITEFIFGAGAIGGLGGAVETRGLGLTTDQGLDRLTEAYSMGIRVVDTADSYGGGESERTVGRWVAEQRPDDVLVQTKVGGVRRADGPGTDLSGPHVERQLAQSIERLGRVDLYLSHAPDPDTPIEETLTAFAAAQEAGLIRAYGVSNVDVRLLESWLTAAADTGLPRPEWLQNNMSLLVRTDERDLLPLVRAESLGYMAFSPLAGGVLSERYLDGAPPAPDSRIALAGDRYYAGMHTPENLARVARLRDVARANGISVAGLALAWLRGQPGVTASIVSPSSDAQWQAVREAMDVEPGADVIAEAAAIFA